MESTMFCRVNIFTLMHTHYSTRTPSRRNLSIFEFYKKKQENQTIKSKRTLYS